MSFPINYPGEIFRPVFGLVCGLNQQILTNGDSVSKPLICNPSTGQSFPLPQVKTRSDERVISYLGYDPINKQFKVLCMTLSYYAYGNAPSVPGKHQVLILGTRKTLSWRMIKCDIRYLSIDREHSHDHIYINGVLYYIAWVDVGGVFPDFGIVCFDIRSEEFKSIRKAQGMEATWKSILINYKGKLAMFQPNNVNRIYIGIQLWVLEDAEKHQWSRYIYVLPPPWNTIYEEKKLDFVGMIRTGEILLSPRNVSDSFYLLYYNPERNTVTKFEIQGMEALKDHEVYTFLDYVEDVKLMATV